MGVHHELPSIKTTFRTVYNLPAPGKNDFIKLKNQTMFSNVKIHKLINADIGFIWDQNFTITCEVYDNNSNIARK